MTEAESKTVLQEFFGNYPLIRVLDYLIDNELEDKSKTEIARGAEVGWTTLFQFWNRLEKNGVVRVTRRFGKTKLYKINSGSPFVKSIRKIESYLMIGATEKDIKEEMIAVARRHKH